MCTQWHIHAATGGLNGDVAFVRGCDSEAFDVTIGASYKDRGIRNDCHDFFGVNVSLPLFLLPEELQVKKAKRGDTTSVSQPGVSAPKPDEDTALPEEPPVKKAKLGDTTSFSQPGVPPQGLDDDSQAGVPPQEFDDGFEADCLLTRLMLTRMLLTRKGPRTRTPAFLSLV